MADSTTTNYGWAYPTVNADADTWGTVLNNAIIAIDAQMHANAAGAQAADTKLTSLSSVAGTANTIPYFSAANTFGLMSVSDGLTLSSGALKANVLSVAGQTGAVTLAGMGLRIGSTRVFVQSNDPGTDAQAGDLWVW